MMLLALGGPVIAEAPWHSLFPRQRPVLPGLAATLPPNMASITPAPLTPAPRTDAAVAQALAMAHNLPPPSDLAGGLARSLVPRVRPPAAAARFAAVQARPADRGSNSSQATVRDRAPSTAGPVERGLCGVRALEGRRLPRITSSTSGCGVAEPVSITSVHGIPLSRAARVDCDLARAFATWVDDSMLPAVGRRGGGIVQIRIVGDYSCRPRNNQAGARISEHGRGMAIDVAGYQLANGDVITLLTHWRRRPHSRDLREMYQGACGTFRTTLGPDSDRFHQDHFHFDLAQHRGGGTYCR